MRNNPTKIIVHHTGGVEDNPKASTAHHTVEDIDAWHKKRWPGFTSNFYKNSQGDFYHVGYHVVIEEDGEIHHTRDYTEEGAHTIGQNTSSIGICLTGNFDVEYPTKEQISSFKEVFKAIHANYPEITVHDVFPHRKYARKSCFGSLLPDDYFSGLLTADLKPTEKEEQRATVEERDAMLKIIELLKLKVSLFLQLLTKQRMKLGKY